MNCCYKQFLTKGISLITAFIEVCWPRNAASTDLKCGILRNCSLSVPRKRYSQLKGMKLFELTRRITIVVATIVALVVASHAQGPTSPLLQDIKVVRDAPVPSSTPLIQKTGSVTPAITAPANAIRTLFPALADVEIPGYSGMIVEALDGSVVAEANSSALFNPASNVKIATAYAILKTFGPDFRFISNVYTDGVIDRTTGTLRGNVYISGKDPMFGYQHAITVANELNRLGITSVQGDLVVTDNFVMNYSASPQRSGEMMFTAMDASKRPAAATREWGQYLSYGGKWGQVNATPSVSFTGAMYVQPIPSSLHLLFTHESAPIREILKVTLCYSNNFLAERLGDMIGGPYAVARLVQLNAGVPPQEFSLATSSGLGYNRVSPNAMMKLLHVLRGDLARYRMTFADIMPVAGIDKGTLENRFDTDFSVGSVVGKTGTLSQTDAGVSALSGEINTRNGRYLFVIFNQRGGVKKFRSFQNYFVSLVQGQFGGPARLAYDAVSLETRLSRSRVSYPGGTGY